MGGDLAIVNSAKKSYEKKATEMGEREKKLLSTLIMPFLRFGVDASHPDTKHSSPLRSTVFVFDVRLPMFLCMQFYKHTIASCFVEAQRNWQQASERYMNLGKGEDYYYPAARLQSQSNKQASSEDEVPKDIEEAWQAALLKNVAAGHHYTVLMEDLGIARELANRLESRFIYTSVEWTCSLESALHFCDLRNEPGAQEEIREYAFAMWVVLQDKCPVVTELWEKRREIIREAVREYLAKM